MPARFCSRFLLIAGLLLSSVCARADTPGTLISDPLPSHFRTGRRFTTALEQPVSGTWKGASLRSLIRRLSRDRELSILLDRRVDPDQEISLEIGERPMRAAVNEIAQVAQLGVTQVGNCLILAPTAPILRLRTLIALRDQELPRDSTNGLARLRTQRGTISWNDLDRPEEVMAGIGRKFGFSIQGIEQIPHDLWAGAVLPDVTAAEALSLVLNQFDLTFEWLPDESAIRLVPVPSKVSLERSYPLRGKSAATTLRTLRSQIEGLEAETSGGKLVVRGTLEQHEQVAAILRGGKTSPRGTSRPSAMPIEKQSFMLQAGGVSLRELFAELKKQGLPLEFDAAALQKAGVDMNRKVSVDLPQLPAAEFLKRLLTPHGLTFRFERGKAVVSPK